MFRTVLYQLSILGRMTGHVSTDKGCILVLKEQAKYCKASHSSASASQQGHKSDGGSQHCGEIQIVLDPDVRAVLPLMAAAALRLAHNSLACLRLMKAKVFTGRLLGVYWECNLRKFWFQMGCVNMIITGYVPALKRQVSAPLLGCASYVICMPNNSTQAGLWGLWAGVPKPDA
jgi:hypothetical protein